MEKWYVAAKKADFEAWGRKFGISPVLARILRNRDLTEEEQVRKFLHGTLEDCYSPWLLKDMDKAVAEILSAVSEGLFIRVIGDYDVDGICSSYILTKGLRLLGARVDTAIPHRIHDGYGLNDNLIEEASRDGVGMIITCDNGIAAAPQIELAGSYGIRVIVTDHHEVPFVSEKQGEREVRRELLPPALAVIDPKQKQCGYPFAGICGAVVAFKVMQALAERTGSDGVRTANVSQTAAYASLKSINAGMTSANVSQTAAYASLKSINAGMTSANVSLTAANVSLTAAMGEFLEFAALATVCDVMELKDENRILVKEGLKRLGSTGNQGLRALMEVNGIEPERLNSYHLGFVLGPCLNATGRLDTAKRALELLQSSTKAEAMSAARELKDLNDSRKNLTLKGVEQAEDYIREHGLEQDKVMVIFLPEVHESLAGIIAGRVRERYNHPVFILTRGEEGVKGSGRSVEGYHMYDAMTEVKRYFIKFGGHAMAAGLSMREEDIEPLRDELNQNCRLSEDDFLPRVHIDVPMPLVYGDEELAGELELLEPFGVGNPKPLFAQKELIFQEGIRMGANKNCARFKVKTPEGAIKQLVHFGDLERFDLFLDEKYGRGSAEKLYAGRADFPVSVVYQLGKNTYRGRTKLQYVMQHYC